MLNHRPSADYQQLRTFGTVPTHRKRLQCQAADGHERMLSPVGAPSLLHPLYQIKSQSILRPLCLEDIKDTRGSCQIKPTIKNQSQSKLHLLHLLLDVIEIIDGQFTEVKWFIVDGINGESFITKQQTIILTSPNERVQSQLINSLYQVLSSNPFLVELLATTGHIPSAKPTTTQQLQHTIYRSLVRLQIRRVVEVKFPIIYKVRQLYGELLQPLCFRSTQYWRAASQLLLSVAADTDIYGAKCQKMLTRIVHLYEYKLFKKQKFIGILLGALKPTIEYISRKLNIKGIYDMQKQFKRAIAKGKIKTTQHPQIEFLQHFRIAHRLPSLLPFEEPLHQPNEQRFVGVERKLPTKNHQDRRSIQLIEYAMHHKNQSKIRADQFQQLLLNYQHQIQYQQKYDNSKTRYFAEIQNEQQLPNHSCLTCSPFFIKDHSLVDINCSAIPFKSFQSIDKFKQIQQQFLATIVQFLNDGGGYVLFGVKRRLMNQIAIGNFINQAQRKQIAEMIERAVKTNIQSLTRLPTNIEVDFAPLRQNPSQQDCNLSLHYNENSHVQKKHLFLEDSYVTRVRIYPTSSAEIYFLRNKQQPRFFANKQGSTKELTTREVIRLIKNKVNTFPLSNQQEPMLSLPQNIFDHKCQRFDYSPSQFKKSTQEQFFNQKQINYSEMCMLIARQKDLPMIKRKLLDRGYRCSIELKFIDEKFASTKHTAVLYIDLQFDRILKEICFSRDFFIKDKPLLTINIQRHVKLQSRNEQNMVTPQFYESIMSWVRNDYKKKVIEVYEYRVGSKRQYFLEMKSKTICLYIYYLLSHLSQRCSFKQPKDLHLLSNQQRQERWIKLFP